MKPTTKSWGQTLCVRRDDYIEVHVAKAVKGGHCSLHRHLKDNEFIVMKGRLQVDIYDETKQNVETHILGPWGVLNVPGRSWHKFIALEDTTFVELYRNPLDPNDIERDLADLGGGPNG